MSKQTVINIGIIGNGFVGQATRLFETGHDSSVPPQRANVNALIYDIVPEKCVPIGLTLKDMVEQTHVVFICVPTPTNQQGECDTTIVKQCINDLHILTDSMSEQSRPFIVVRSTVPIGFCEQYHVNHMPEFLTEANWRHDFHMCELWVIGVADTPRYRDFEVLMGELLNTAHRNGCIKFVNKRYVDTNTSEFIKYGRNCFLAVKLSLCNEYYAFCTASGINYNEAISIIGDDRRIGTRYTSVPGVDGKKGWGGTCLPKDTCAFSKQFQSIGVQCPVLDAAILRNNQIDRPEQDWKDDENKGRTFV
jgi:UDPglucose 6-dehydrogenase